MVTTLHILTIPIEIGWPLVEIGWPLVKIGWPLVEIGWLLVEIVQPLVKIGWPLVEIGWPVDGVEEKEHGGEGDKEEDVSLAVIIWRNWKKAF